MSHDHHRKSVPEQHKERAPASARVYVITCSDSRTAATDEGGRYIKSRLADLGHLLAGSAIVPDEPQRILEELQRARGVWPGAAVVPAEPQRILEELQRARGVSQVALITGGTGLSSRDSTFEAVCGLIARPLPGFGELFRMLSFQEIGAAAMLSRAVGGVTREGLLVFAMPGSPAAVKLACEKLVFPELGHLLGELGR